MQQTLHGALNVGLELILHCKEALPARHAVLERIQLKLQQTAAFHVVNARLEHFREFLEAPGVLHAPPELRLQWKVQATSPSARAVHQDTFQIRRLPLSARNASKASPMQTLLEILSAVHAPNAALCRFFRVLL